MDLAVFLGLLAFWPWWKYGYILPKLIVITAGLGIALTKRKRLTVYGRGALLLLVAIVSSVGSRAPQLSLHGYPMVWTLGLAQCVVYLLLTGFSSERPWLRYVGVLLSAHALIQLAGLDPTAALPHGRAIATIGHPVDLGAVLAMALPVSGPWWPLILAGIWATGSRSAYLAVAAIVFVRLPWRWKLTAWAAFVIAAPFLFARLPAKDSHRIDLWRAAWAEYRAHPIIGTGPDTFYLTYLERKAKDTPNQAHAHNDLLQAASTLGTVGLLAYLWAVLPLLSNPSLLALFVVLKFGPVSFEVLCAAALIAGTHLRRASEKSA